MSAGRKKQLGNVVPMVGDIEADKRIVARHDEQAREAAARLKPAGLPPDESRIWDLMAPDQAHPERVRITSATRHAFAMLCYAVADFHRYDKELRRVGYQYSAATRNGLQWKKRPALSARAEAWDKAWRAMLDFGMTPVSATRVLEEPGQTDLFDSDDAAAQDFA